MIPCVVWHCWQSFPPVPALTMFGKSSLEGVVLWGYVVYVDKNEVSAMLHQKQNLTVSGQELIFLARLPVTNPTFWLITLGWLRQYKGKSNKVWKRPLGREGSSFLAWAWTCLWVPSGAWWFPRQTAGMCRLFPFFSCFYSSACGFRSHCCIWPV